MFIDSKEMKELCGNYMPFPLSSLTENNSEWNGIFKFQKKLSMNDYLNLLKNIRNDKKNLKDNLHRIQLIYSYILNDIEFDSICTKNVIKSQEKILYLLSENNQWKLANELYFYIDNHSNEVLPCLKLDFKNKNHRNLQKLLDLFNIKSIGMNDLILEHKHSSSVEELRKKLIEISPYLKNWLKKLSVSFEIISSIDKILQQNIVFMESDCLQLFYNKTFVQETNVYFDKINQQFYIIRPWNSETSLMELPNKLCQLLNIQGFEDKLRFLLKAAREEIIRHFDKLSIDIPTDEDIIILQPFLPKSGYFILKFHTFITDIL